MPELESICEVPQPENIAVLVHGTVLLRGPLFSRGTWIREDSHFCKRLVSELGPRVSVFRFNWSGRNSGPAREVASAALRLRLLDLVARFPRAQHIVIGHSHGGNVALSAADTTALARRVKTICLSTPILRAIPRHALTDTNRFIFLVLSVAGLSFACGAHFAAPSLPVWVTML